MADNTTPEPNDTKQREIDRALRDLSNPDPQVRAEARHALLEISTPATPALIKVLNHSSSNLRWEAAKTLSTMRDPAATEALIATLDDARQDIRWLAALGLIAIGKASIRPLLRKLLTDSDNVDLQHAAHHILAKLQGQAPEGVLGPVVAALRGSVPALEAPLAAFRALEMLRDQTR